MIIEPAEDDKGNVKSAEDGGVVTEVTWPARRWHSLDDVSDQCGIAVKLSRARFCDWHATLSSAKSETAYCPRHTRLLLNAFRCLL
jgi:hypothetical protein